MAKSKKELKDMSIIEASDFWDEHDFFEFDDIQEVSDITFDFQKKRYIGLDLKLYKELEQLAKKMHKSCDSLVQDWLKEKVGNL